MSELEIVKAENAELRRKLDRACEFAHLLNERFLRVWRASVATDPEIEAFKDGMQTEFFINTRLR